PFAVPFPSSDVRTTRSGPLIRARHPSHCSALGFVTSSCSSATEPTWTSGTWFPLETLRSTMFGVLKLLLGERSSVPLVNSVTLAHSTTTLSPITSPRPEARLDPCVNTSMPVHGEPLAPARLFCM